MSSLDKKAIRSDIWMQRFMKTGIPVAIVSIICLWAGWLFKIPGLGSVFMITASIALIIGLLYNVRFVILSVRQLKEKQDD
ncbi:hypothetical protein [Neptuniibacter sp. CAU 1671]|uniref:hypothetical protein n=1 Tax=Neptuniibacter sp. CAU 1671 TaxID=3032593 RepID=UPI0023DA492E|nr:hypothetical protein [Neptuniibacter sp. CAU 1671]MDF2182414.1 hypothetical protein [Neptuniibacter sp. CAU 1671]